MYLNIFTSFAVDSVPSSGRLWSARRGPGFRRYSDRPSWQRRTFRSPSFGPWRPCSARFQHNSCTKTNLFVWLIKLHCYLLKLSVGIFRQQCRVVFFWFQEPVEIRLAQEFLLVTTVDNVCAGFQNWFHRFVQNDILMLQLFHQFLLVGFCGTGQVFKRCNFACQGLLLATNCTTDCLETVPSPRQIYDYENNYFKLFSCLIAFNLVAVTYSFRRRSCSISSSSSCVVASSVGWHSSASLSLDPSKMVTPDFFSASNL